MRLLPTQQFETADPTLQGLMRVTFTLSEREGGAELVGLHEHLPRGVAPADNELGWRMSLDELAALLGAH